MLLQIFNKVKEVRRIMSSEVRVGKIKEEINPRSMSPQVKYNI
jgi:hypothetical protein